MKVEAEIYVNRTLDNVSCHCSGWTDQIRHCLRLEMYIFTSQGLLHRTVCGGGKGEVMSDECPNTVYMIVGVIIWRSPFFNMQELFTSGRQCTASGSRNDNKMHELPSSHKIPELWIAVSVTAMSTIFILIMHTCFWLTQINSCVCLLITISLLQFWQLLWSFGISTH